MTLRDLVSGFNCDLVCVEEPCFCWDDSVYKPAEDTWLAWELVEELPYVGGLGVDVGCGSGALLNVISKKVERVVGVDLNPCAVKACKSCGFEALLCSSMSCLREADLVVANLPYLPCSDDMSVCESYLPQVLEGLKVKENGYLILIYSSLTTIDPLRMLKGFRMVMERKVNMGMEELIGMVLRREPQNTL
ncbi:methylase [Ignicoccus pacificus DSM 13166]|uniref:Methylase n=1 Tax=Ignicoccus pacificus DSM 13166 TaxID=940294 RepID=A0A977PJS0_9CREN|nr:methylase [Ignicoccus pacificus DSM 13166]